MRVRLKSKTQISNNVILLEFETDGQIINFQAGQFFELTLINPLYTDNRGNARHFGFVNPPGGKEIQMIMKNGVSAFKRSIMEMPIGTDVELDKINGFIDLPTDINQTIVFVAGGIGIAPIMSIMRFVSQNNLNYKINLIYVYEAIEEILFAEELKKYASSNPNLKLALSDTINAEVIKNIIQNLTSNLYFVKGEQKFVLYAVQILKDLGVEVNKISMEIFTGY
jgi:ferredoxin-NADP reductase